MYSLCLLTLTFVLSGACSFLPSSCSLTCGAQVKEDDGQWRKVGLTVECNDPPLHSLLQSSRGTVKDGTVCTDDLVLPQATWGAALRLQGVSERRRGLAVIAHLFCPVTTRTRFVLLYPMPYQTDVSDCRVLVEVALWFPEQDEYEGMEGGYKVRILTYEIMYIYAHSMNG